MLFSICSFVGVMPNCALFCLQVQGSGDEISLHLCQKLAIYFKMFLLLISESLYDQFCSFRRWHFFPEIRGEREENLRAFVTWSAQFSKNCEKLLFPLFCLPCVYLWLFSQRGNGESGFVSWLCIYNLFNWFSQMYWLASMCLSP